MSAWPALERELARWGEAGRRLPFWWRDDDATAATPALEHLLATVGGRPLGLAVIPADAGDDLAERLSAAPEVAVLQHGWRHLNGAPAGAPKAELGEGRPLAALAADVRAGRAALAARFGARALAVLVPPWNRIAPALVAALPSLGIGGLSADRPRAPAPGLVQAHAAVDPIDWRGGRGFLGEGPVLDRLVREAAAVRSGMQAGPVGLLSHHAAADRECWRFLDRIARTMAAHPAVAWLDPVGLFAMQEMAEIAT